MMSEVPVSEPVIHCWSRNMRMHYYLNRRLGSASASASAESYMRSSFFHVPQTLMQAIVSSVGRHTRDDPRRYN